MRKIIALFAFAVIGAATLSAQPILTPYQYRNRIFLAVQGGPSLFVSEYCNTFSNHGRGGSLFAPYGEVSLGYYFTDAHIIRVSVGYDKKNAALPPSGGFFPYSFHSANLFVDYMLNYNALEEVNVPFNVMLYVGLGGGFTAGFSEPEYILNNPETQTVEEVKAWLPTVNPINVVPGIRVGMLFEYDLPNNLGFLFDLGAEAFTDTYNGLEPDTFPLDLQVNATFGLVYHFGKAKIVTMY
jgi:hypothetical protein